MDKPVDQIRILMLEDVPSDAELEEAELRDAGLNFIARRVDTRTAFEQALDEFKPDIVLADYRLPNYNGREALEHTRRTHPHVPVVMVTGALGDEAAVELLKLGAMDYVLKDRLVRLAPAIRRALAEERGIRSRELAEEKYRALFSEAMDGIVLVDYVTAQVADCNPEFERQTGRTLEQLRQMKMFELLLLNQREPAQRSMFEVQQAGGGRGAAFTFVQPGGQTVPIEFSSRYLDLQGHGYIQSVTRDITERVRAEEALRESEARYKRITEGLTDYLYTVHIENGQAVKTLHNVACQKVTGYTMEEFTATGDLWLQMVVPEDRDAVLRQVAQALNGQDVPPFEHRIRRKDGEVRWINNTIILFKDASGKLQSYDGVVRDVTERVNAELALRDSEDKFRTIAASALDAILMLDGEGRMSYWNAAAEKIFGYAAAEAVGQFLHLFLAPARFHDDFSRGFAHFQETGEGPFIGKTLQLAALRKGGAEFPIELSVSAIKRAGEWNGIGILRDITDRKQAEDAMRRTNRALQTLSAGNMVLVQADNESDLLRAAMEVVVKKSGYSLAVVDFSGDEPEKELTPISWAGMEGAEYWGRDFTWADTERGQTPSARAIRSGITQICHDIASEAGFEPWRPALLARNYVSNIALPLRGDGGVFGCLSIYSTQKEDFDPEEVKLLEELANDLAYGIINLRVRRQHEQHAMTLRHSLEQFVQAIAGTIEARDPYTAGHQKRVSALATAIARQMALPEEQINGIQLAAIIHDLGKIHVPAEILSRPGKLSEAEFMLIKAHPLAGYDIVKDIEFPWPIADIILQHHERLDGTGYPRGLAGAQIMLESRILTVADVVEAMSSHRPYRPALGLEAAMGEIRRGRGSAYDPAVVDACLAIVTEKGYRMDTL